jgi:hypothetical protein
MRHTADAEDHLKILYVAENRSSRAGISIGKD